MACIVSAKARSCIPVRQNWCAGFMRIIKQPDGGHFAAVEQLSENNGVIFLRDLLEMVPDPAIPTRGR